MQGLAFHRRSAHECVQKAGAGLQGEAGGGPVRAGEGDGAAAAAGAPAA